MSGKTMRMFDETRRTRVALLKRLSLVAMYGLGAVT